LLDCIGFVQAHRQKLVQASGLPVILSSALIAKFVGEMVAG
jgi:protein AroM